MVSGEVLSHAASVKIKPSNAVPTMHRTAVGERAMGEARMAGRLYIVATPIGNLADVTLRSADILRTVPIIACEDTRRTRILLAHIGAEPGRIVAVHDHNEDRATDRVVAELDGGSDVALVSDAGTPLISDPGFELVRAAWRRGIPVTPVPGCSAVMAALAASPIPITRFRFEGFLPSKAGPRRDVLERLVAEDAAVVFFEAPHRMREALGALVQHGAGGRSILVCRELTKRFESLSFGTVDETLSNGTVLDRGEFTCILAPAQRRPDGDVAHAAVVKALAAELPPAQAARLASKITGRPRAELYDLAKAASAPE